MRISESIIDYRYNAQGLLTHINNTALIDDGIHNHEDYDVFGQELTYFTPSPEYDDPASVQQGDPLVNYNFSPQYGGQVSSMMWNAKSPTEDGTTLSRNAYVYKYDDLGQMTNAYYAADDPAMPGEFVENLGYYDEHVNYDLGGNIVKLNRHNFSLHTVNNDLMDELTYSYTNGGYQLQKVDDAGISFMSTGFKHFVDGANAATEYNYDVGGKLLLDANRGVSFTYNPINLPKKVDQLNTGYQISYTYDAAGNKLQKHTERPQNATPPYVPVFELEKNVDYIGNFVYENGQIAMIYHPEGVIRPTPSSANNETDYVYDYFIKDYLGNVRAVVTEEDAEYTNKFLATLEEVHAIIEEENFDNIYETRSDLPSGYPANGSLYLNQKIAELSALNGTEMGPSMVMPVKRGDKVSLRTEYFYQEDAPGTVYDDLGSFVHEILIALATSGAGTLQLSESQLISLASGDPTYITAITNLLDNNIDDRDINNPNAYLVWMHYDVNMNLLPQASGAIQVQNPNSLETLLRDQIRVTHDGYLHAYVSNGSEVATSFDNFLVTHQQGKLRQINDYYPYGLSISGINGDYDEYLNKYTTKELQTGEFDVATSTGLEMFDFGSRYYDPQLGRWFTPDPAEQFSNPYLGIGNNPVVYVDPNGTWALAPLIVAAGVVGGAFAQASTGNDSFTQLLGGGLIGGAAAFGGYGVGAAVGTAVGSGFIGGAVTGAAGGFASGFSTTSTIEWYNGASFSEGFNSGMRSGVMGAATGAVIGGVIGGLTAKNAGLDFWHGTEIVNVDKFVDFYYKHLTASINSGSNDVRLNPTTGNDSQDYAKMLKAYKLAKMKLRLNEKFTLDDILEMDALSKSAYWDQGSLMKMRQTRLFQLKNGNIKASVDLTNDFISDVYVKGNKLSLMAHDGSYLKARVSLTFDNKDLVGRAWNYIYWDGNYNIIGPTRKY